jgi:hypothetical protein
MEVLKLNITRFSLTYYGDKRKSYFTINIFSFSLGLEVLTAMVYKEFSIMRYIHLCSTLEFNKHVAIIIMVQTGGHIFPRNAG